MSRTSSSDVELIIEVDAGADLDPFIETASLLVTKHCVTLGGLSEDSDAEELELVERWLSAHFYSIFSPRAKSESAGPVSQSIESKVDLGFDVTRHGQQAMRLDSTGQLAKLNEDSKRGGKSTVGMTWVGGSYDEEFSS